jgi:O-antigen/teichoic acid export membrane protein
MSHIRKVGGFAAAGALAQAGSLVAGILVVRALDKDQYALYAIFLSTVGMVGLLANSGVNSVLLARAGKALSRGLTLAPLFVAANRVRLITAAGLMLPAGVLAAVLLVANGSTWGETAMLVVFLVATVWTTLVASVYRLAIQVYGEYRSIQWLDLSFATVRTAFTALLFLFGVAWAPWFALIAVAIAGADAWASWRLACRDDRWGTAMRRSAESSGPFVRALRQTLPANIALVAGEQLVTILLTANGNTAAIADIAALSRFAAAFLVVNSIFSNIVSPALSRSAHDPVALTKRAILAVGGYLALAILYVVATVVLSGPILWLLGPEYAGLQTQLAIVACGTAITSFAVYGLGALTFGLGWTTLTWTYIPLLIAWVAFGLSLDLSQSLNAMLFAASLSLVRLANQLIRVIYGVLTSRPMPDDARG